MSKITVLVAVYNAEKYLSKCLQSLQNQTLHDIRVICIDDASTDSSYDILNSFAQNDERFTIIHFDKNMGQPHATNEGLKMVTSPYVCFLDSDDWFAPNSLEKVVESFEANPLTDCVLFRCINVYYDHEEEYAMPAFDRLSGQEAFEASLTWKIHGIYAVRTPIHQKYPYDDTSRTYSNDNTTRIHYLVAREVRLSDGIYYYRQHASSMTHQVNVSRFNYLIANASMKRQLIEHHVDDRILSIYENVRWLNVVDLYMFYYQHRNELTSKERAYGLHKIKETWGSIELKRLTIKNHYKFGYCPFRPLFFLFRIQEELYFTLRALNLQRIVDKFKP